MERRQVVKNKKTKYLTYHKICALPKPTPKVPFTIQELPNAKGSAYKIKVYLQNPKNSFNYDN